MQGKENQFLFQTGSIKRPWFRKVENLLKGRFYSKLVRLKVEMRSEGILESFLSFYSKLVRLKADAYTRPKHGILFLFQTGSIKSENRIVTFTGSTGFYSKLVRLKASDGDFTKGSVTLVSIPNWFD